jgi:hypothetical protein
MPAARALLLSIYEEHELAVQTLVVHALIYIYICLNNGSSKECDIECFKIYWKEMQNERQKAVRRYGLGSSGLGEKRETGYDNEPFGSTESGVS